jgi:pimeloyl-ACP methyl ester carboxylesterase
VHFKSRGEQIMSTATLKIQSPTLKVPGAQLYYEVQGTGPVLLTIPGGPTDAGIFAGLARFLADRYTVVSYDPRGNSRSVLDGPPEDQRMDVHGDDAAQLLAALSGEPAYVLGSSGGAQIGLNLAARYPHRVHTLVAHEPPCVQLLHDAAEQRAFTESVYNTYRADGVGPAMQKFIAAAGLAGGPQPEKLTSPSPPPPEIQEAFGRIQGNLDFFLAHGLKPISLYVPDVTTLRAGSPWIVVGVGETSAGQLAYRCAVALAQQLGTAPVSFPGGHGGYGDQAAAFSERLHHVLRRTHVSSTRPEQKTSRRHQG